MQPATTAQPRRVAPDLRDPGERRAYVERLGHVGRLLLEARENVDTLLGELLLRELVSTG